MKNLRFENGFNISSYNMNHKRRNKKYVSETELDNHEFNIDVNFEKELFLHNSIFNLNFKSLRKCQNMFSIYYSKYKFRLQNYCRIRFNINIKN